MIDKTHLPLRIIKISSRKFMLFENSNIFGVDIPAGYVTNGSSVPRAFWFILSPFTEGFRAAIVHDFRYSKKDSKFSRREADIEFFNNLKECGVNIIRRSLAYVSLRLFGWMAWK